MWSTVGHNQQKSVLEKAVESGSFSHAYLFSGSSRIGKKTLAIEFAKKILELDPSVAFHPDLIILQNQDVRIEAMRNLTSELSLRPFSQKYKVVVIDNFESATEEAANSILKTLEEPTPSSIIILITSNKAALLPTIISRCHNIYFSSSEGKIGDKIRSERDPEFNKQLQSDLAEWKAIQKSDRLGRLASIKRFAELETQEIEQMLERWIELVAEEMPDRPQNYNVAQALSTAQEGIRRNFNKKLVFEKLFLNINI